MRIILSRYLKQIETSLDLFLCFVDTLSTTNSFVFHSLEKKIGNIYAYISGLLMAEYCSSIVSSRIAT